MPANGDIQLQLRLRVLQQAASVLHLALAFLNHHGSGRDSRDAREHSLERRKRIAHAYPQSKVTSLPRYATRRSTGCGGCGRPPRKQQQHYRSHSYLPDHYGSNF